MSAPGRLRYTIPPAPDDLVIDNSTMSAFLKCELQAALEYGLHLKPAKEGAAAVVGQAGHAAMAEWIDTSGDIERAMLVYRKEYQAVAAPAVDRLAPTDPDTIRLGYDRTAKILRRWLEEHPQDAWSLVIAPGDTELPVSALFMKMPDGRRVVMVALLDALAKRRKGGFWSCDHKFRRLINDYWKGKQEDSAQFTGQKWLAGRWDLGIAGIYVNAIELNPPHTSEKTCRDHGEPYVVCSWKHARAELFPVSRSAHEIAAWKATMKVKVPRWVGIKTKLAPYATEAAVGEGLVVLREMVLQGEIAINGRWNESCLFCGHRLWCKQQRPVGGRSDYFVFQPWNPLAERRSAA